MERPRSSLAVSLGPASSTIDLAPLPGVRAEALPAAGQEPNSHVRRPDSLVNLGSCWIPPTCWAIPACRWGRARYNPLNAAMAGLPPNVRTQANGDKLTAVRELWQVPSFKRAVLALMTLPRHVLDGLATEQNLADLEPVDPLDVGEDWDAATSALRTLYSFARSDSVDSVIADIRVVLAERDNADQYDVGVSLLPVLLAPRESFDRHQRYKRAREMALPQILEFAINIQLTTVDPGPESSSPVELVPLIVMRIVFDEAVLGGEAVSMSVPIEVMESMRHEMGSLREKYEHLVKTLPQELLKPEAYIPWPEHEL